MTQTQQPAPLSHSDLVAQLTDPQLTYDCCGGVVRGWDVVGFEGSDVGVLVHFTAEVTPVDFDCEVALDTWALPVAGEPVPTPAQYMAARHHLSCSDELKDRIKAVWSRNQVSASAA